MFGRQHWRQKHRRHLFVVFFVNDIAILLPHNKRVTIMDTLSVGHTDTLGFAIFDQHGNPMLTPVALDGPAAWSSTAPASPPVDTLAVAADGNSAVVKAVGPGSDTISLALSIGGVKFAASLQITVTPEAQVPTSIAITSQIG